MRNFLLLALLALCSQPGKAQEALRGKVFLADTRKPVGLANVYLSNTSIGTVTAEDGSFSISPFPQGRFELVVSFIGYDPYTLVVQSGKLPPLLEIHLSPKVVELQEVIVTPYEKNGWASWGNFFLSYFIGTSAYAPDCKLLNKETIKFRHSKKQGILEAFADEPLRIENKALGYNLRYDLTKFEFNFNTRVLVVQGYPFFTEMQSDRSAQQRRWEKNREETYSGSLMHFMRSLFRNRLVEQKFQVRRQFKLSDEEKKRVRSILATGRLVANPDSAAYYQLVVTEPDRLTVIGTDILPGDSIAFGVDSATAGFRFNNYLHVTYPPKKIPFEYRNIFRIRDADSPIVSELLLPDNKIIKVLANGSYYEGVNLLVSGYWGWAEKIATMLPFDYWPPGIKGIIN